MTGYSCGATRKDAASNLELFTLAEHGIPASTLTDNGMVFTTGLSQGKKGAGTRNGFENELRHLGIVQKNSTPGHPTTCGKVERSNRAAVPRHLVFITNVRLSPEPTSGGHAFVKGKIREFIDSLNDRGQDVGPVATERRGRRDRRPSAFAR